MDPFQINAAYRQDELLEEARAEGLLKEARAGRSTDPTSSPLGLLGRLLWSGRRLGRPRPISSPRKATV